MNATMLTTIWGSFVSAAIVFGFMYLTKIIMDKLVASKYDANWQIEENDNLAVALRRLGLYGGVAIAMLFTIGSDVVVQLIDGATIVAFMVIALLISEKIVFPSVDNTLALRDKNVALGFAEGGLFIATGIIAMGSMSGEGPWVSTIVFFALGQVVLLVAVKILEKIHSGLLKDIVAGNTAAGIMLGGLTIAYALILKGAISGPFTGWEYDIGMFFLSTILGGILLFVFANTAIDKLFLPGTSIKKEIQEKNVAAISVVVTLKIAIAFIIGGAVI